jgi:putative hydrolase of the HAD superfamily
MRISTIFFDLDDTLYPSSAGLWKAIKARMNEYMRAHLNIPAEEIPPLREKYFMQYGTTLRGLQAHHNVDTEEYLAYVHDLPLQDYLVPDAVQRSIIASLPTRNLIFTNADSPHAQRVLTVLGLNDLFATIVDVNAISPYCKPMRESFDIAMRTAGENDPAHCVMIDDLTRTTSAARAAGMSSILYGGTSSDGDANAAFTDWNELPKILESL